MGRKVLPILVICVLCSCFAALWAGERGGMKKEELKARLGDPDVVVIDVRAPLAWNRSSKKIAGALREDPMDVDGWIVKYPRGKTYVFYCT